MACAWSEPLHSDTTALSWLFNDNTPIKSQAVNALPLEVIVSLATHYEAQSDVNRAGQLYDSILNYCGLSAAQSCKYAKSPKATCFYSQSLVIMGQFPRV